MACLAMPFWKWAFTPQKVSCCLGLARLPESVVMEVSVVAVIMEDLDSMFCRVLFEGKLGGKCFVRLFVKLEVDKSEAAEVVDEDGGALVALLGKFAFQL